LVFDLRSCIFVSDQEIQLRIVFDQKEAFSTVAIENQPSNNHLAGIVQEKTLPAGTRLAGWAALVQTFGVQASTGGAYVVTPFVAM
jgi:hypothetical protein